MCSPLTRQHASSISASPMSSRWVVGLFSTALHRSRPRAPAGRPPQGVCGVHPETDLQVRLDERPWAVLDHMSSGLWYSRVLKTPSWSMDVTADAPSWRGRFEAGEQQMGQSRRASRQQAMVRRQRRKRRRVALLIVAPVVIAAIVSAVALTRQPEYSGLDVIGKQPTIVQVFLPG